MKPRIRVHAVSTPSNDAGPENSRDATWPDSASKAFAISITRADAGVSTAGDLTYTFNRCNGLGSKLRGAGHTRAWYWANTDCWETDIRDSDQGGDDRSYVDDVDLFYIETHGNHESDGQARMLYDTPQTGWRTYSGKWQLGENWNCEWVMAFSCKTVDRNNVGGL